MGFQVGLDFFLNLTYMRNETKTNNMCFGGLEKKRIAFFVYYPYINALKDFRAVDRSARKGLFRCGTVMPRGGTTFSLWVDVGRLLWLRQLFNSVSSDLVGEEEIVET